MRRYADTTPSIWNCGTYAAKCIFTLLMQLSSPGTAARCVGFMVGLWVAVQPTPTVCRQSCDICVCLARCYLDVFAVLACPVQWQSATVTDTRHLEMLHSCISVRLALTEQQCANCASYLFCCADSGNKDSQHYAHPHRQGPVCFVGQQVHF